MAFKRSSVRFRPAPPHISRGYPGNWVTPSFSFLAIIRQQKLLAPPGRAVAAKHNHTCLSIPEECLLRKFKRLSFAASIRWVWGFGPEEDGAEHEALGEGTLGGFSSGGGH